MKRIIYGAAGTDPQLISECPEHEKRRNLYIGLLVLLVSVLSFISVTFAAYKLFDFNIFNSAFDIYLNYLLSSVIGIFWFMIVFNLYRACLTLSGIGDGTSKITRKEVLQSLPQVVLATILACCLAVPLNILLLDREVDNGITVLDIDRFMEKEESQLNKHYQQLIDKYMDQNSGADSNKVREDLFKSLKEYKEITQERNSKSFIGIMGKIFNQHPFLSVVIFVVAIHLYVVPIFLRILWVKGVYEFLVEFQNQIVLEKYGIYVNYFKVVYDGEHLLDRFLSEERAMNIKNN